MDLLQLSRQTVTFSRDLLRVVERLAGELGSVEDALAEITRAAEDAAPGTRLVAVLEELEVELDTVLEQFGRYQNVIRLLASKLGDLGERSQEWTLVEDDTTERIGGDLAVSVSGELAARLATDVDGEAADGRILFSPSDEVLIQASVSGVLEGNLGAKRNLGEVAGTLGVEAEGAVTVTNHFRHSTQDDTLPALIEDLTDFRLPGRLDRGNPVLRHHLDPAGILMPDQWIEVQARGQLAVAGNLAWSQSWASAATLSDEGLGIDAVLPIKAGAQLGLDFSYRLGGFYDLLVRCADHDPRRLRVEVRKGRRSEAHLGIDLGAQVEVRGLDRVARGLLARFEPVVDRFFELAAEIEELEDLEALLTENLDRELDDLLDDERLERLQAGIEKIVTDVDVQELLREMIRTRVLELAAEPLEDLQERVDELLEPLLQLIRRVRKVKARIDAAIRKAAKVKVAVSFSHARNRLRENESLLTFEIDPVADPNLYRRMLLGDFATALEAAEAGDNSLVLIDGVLKEKGSLTITNDLNVTAFGITVGSGSIFHQEWQAKVDLQGNLTMSVEGSLENVQRRWGRVRTFAFLADTNLVARAARLRVLEDVAFDHAVSLELTERIEKKHRKRLEELEEILVAMEAVPPGTGLHRDLVLDLGGRELREPLELSVALRPGEVAQERLFTTTPVAARRQFALALGQFDDAYRALDRLDDDGLPLVLWPHVQREFDERQGQSGGNLIRTTSALRFISGSRTARVQGTEVQILFTRWRWVQAVGATFAELVSLPHTAGRLTGLDREQALEEVRKLQKRLLRAARPVLDNSIFGSPRPHYAFFQTIFQLAGGPSESLDPFVVVRRHEAEDPPDGRVFVFG